MGADTKPTIFLIPGAFARPACYDVLRPILQDQGYETATCALPSSDPAQAEECSCAADAEYIRQAHLVPLVEQQGKDVVVFAHSYGAQCGGPAANGLIHSTRRAQGKPGGVLGLIYLAGTIVPKDASLTDVMGSSEWPPYFRIDHPRKGCTVIEPVIDVLYGDADVKDHEQLEATMTPHALSAFTTKSPEPASASAALDSRRVYIRTAQDRCQPPPVQDMYMKSSGVEWVVEGMDASHGAFFTRPVEVAKIIDAYATKWA